MASKQTFADYKLLSFIFYMYIYIKKKTSLLSDKVIWK